jgi:hypothetical protein
MGRCDEIVVFGMVGRQPEYCRGARGSVPSGGDPGRSALTGLLDLHQPVALLMFAVLHFISDTDGPGELIGAFQDVMVPGSYLVISHSTDELHPVAPKDTAQEVYRQTATPLTTRTRAEVQTLFTGFDLLEPGVALLETWRPGPAQDVEHAERYPLWAGVGCKP